MTTEEDRLHRLTVSEVRKRITTFEAIGKNYAETHSCTAHLRSIAWDLVMVYLQREYAAWVEQMERVGWTSGQLKARSFAVDLVVRGLRLGHYNAA